MRRPSWYTAHQPPCSRTTFTWSPGFSTLTTALSVPGASRTLAQAATVRGWVAASKESAAAAGAGARGAESAEGAGAGRGTRPWESAAATAARRMSAAGVTKIRRLGGDFSSADLLWITAGYAGRESGGCERVRAAAAIVVWRSDGWASAVK